MTHAQCVYANIVQSSMCMWEGKLHKGQELVKPFCDRYLAAAVAYGETLMWNTSFDASESLVQEAMSYYEQLEIRANQLLESSKPPSMISGFFGFGKRPVETPEQLLKKQEHHIESLTALGDINGAIAMLLMKNQHRVKGAYRLRKAWKFYKEAYDLVLLHPHWGPLLQQNRGHLLENENLWQDLLHGIRQDTAEIPESELHAKNVVSRIVFGKGLFIYSISMLPRALQWFVELIGFTSDQTQGLLDLLEVNHISPSPRCFWSRVVIGGIRFFMFEEEDQALNLVEQMLTELPESPFLHSSLGGMYRTKGELEKSTENYQAALNTAADLPQIALMLAYEISHNYFLQLRYTEAIPGIENYIKNSPSKNFKAYGGFKLGVCYWNVHQEAYLPQIRELYSRVINEFQRPQMSFDQYAARLCQRFIDKSCFTKIEMLFLELQNLSDARGFDQAFEKLRILREEITTENLQSNPDVWGMYLYYKGHLHQLSKNFDKAHKNFAKLFHLAEQLTEDRWILVYAEVESAEIYIEHADFARANQILELAKSRSGFDFEKHIGMRIKKLQAKVKRLSEKAQVVE